MKRSKHPLLTSVFFIAVLLVWQACQSNTVEQPALSDDQLARIMADLSIADAATNGMVGFSKDSLMRIYFNQVFEMHGVSLEAYEKDLRIIAKDLSHMEQIVKKADELLTEKTSGNPELAPQK